jgi:hypothetical protein
MGAEPAYFSGLDLGQTADHSALAVAERTTHPDPVRPDRTVYHFAVRHLHRWPLGTPYPQVVADTKRLFAAPPLSGSVLAIDRTGVGRAVSDLFSSAGVDARLRPITITGGENSGGGSVAKKDLVGAVQVPLQDGRLKIASGLPLADVLAEELAAFRVKVTLAGNETYESWRERDHDDLVLAVALALYVGNIPPVLMTVIDLGPTRPRPGRGPWGFR